MVGGDHGHEDCVTSRWPRTEMECGDGYDAAGLYNECWMISRVSGILYAFCNIIHSGCITVHIARQRGHFPNANFTFYMLLSIVIVSKEDIWPMERTCLLHWCTLEAHQKN